METNVHLAKYIATIFETFSVANLKLLLTFALVNKQLLHVKAEAPRKQYGNFV